VVVGGKKRKKSMGENEEVKLRGFTDGLASSRFGMRPG
jgi:hypothetical protein